MATLLKIDRNGSRHYEGFVTCDRCGGAGSSTAWQYTGLTCYKCGGTGKVFAKWIERTPEYQAKLDAKRAAKHAKEAAEREAKAAAEAAARAEREAEQERQKAEEAARKAAEKARSCYVGTVGEKLTVSAVYQYSAHFTVSFGYSQDIMFIHNFKDAAGNVLVWKTTKGLALTEGDAVKLTGTVKEHSTYKDEKQTVLLRCKIEK